MIILILLGLLIFFIGSEQWVATALCVYSLVITKMFLFQTKKYNSLLNLARKVSNRIKPNREKHMVSDKEAFNNLVKVLKSDN